MRRKTGCLVNLILAVAAATLPVLLAFAADHVLGRIDPGPPFPGFAGLLFPPNLESRYETHDYTSEERINSFGFRDREISLVKTGTCRIVAIGDSFTYGWGVNLDQTWVKVVEENLRRQGLDVEVLNLGKPAANPWQYANIAEKVIPALKPDLVLVGVLAGDDLQQTPDSDEEFRYWLTGCFPNLSRLHRDWEYFLGGPWVLLPQRPKSAEESRQEWVNIAKSVLQKMDSEQHARFDKLEDEVKQAFLRGGLNPWLIAHATGGPDYFMCTSDPDSAELASKTKVLAQQLGRLKKAADRQHVPVLVLSIPEGFYVNDEAYKNVQRIGFHVVPQMLMSEVADNAVVKACNAAGLKSLVVSQGFRDRRGEQKLYFELDRHMSAEGNKLFGNLVTPGVADAVAKAPRKQQ